MPSGYGPDENLETMKIAELYIMQQQWIIYRQRVGAQGSNSWKRKYDLVNLINLTFTVNAMVELRILTSAYIKYIK